MSKFYGKIGYVGLQETDPGVYEEFSESRPYYGDVLWSSRRWDRDSDVHDELTLANKISVLVDPYAYEHLQDIKWVEYKNSKWRVTNIEDQYPRIVLTLGGVYNG